MGLRCSLLGHDFGEPEVEREREERGSEVVLTVREVAECSRCSKTNVVTENKEVTALHDGDERDEPSDTPSVEPDATPESSTDEASDSDEEDDAMIIEDEDTDDDGRAHGEWPESDEPDEPGDDADDAPAEWPTLDSDDEGFDARPSTAASPPVEFGGGLAPERATVEEEEGLEYVESAEPGPTGPGSANVSAESADADDGFTKAGAAPAPSEPATADANVDAEFVCPQCGFVDDVVGSSLRAGDVCPDCRKGYLAEQER